jgi:cytochrome c oxidase accessory protein FixG
VFAGLLVILLGLPLVTIHGNPAVLLDIPGRRFFLLGQAFNGQDAWLLFFLLTGVGFSLVSLTAVYGRVWCGWACPQTVFVEGVYRRIERLIEGPREARIKLDHSEWTANKIARRGAKHLAYVIISLGLAHLLLGYFFPVRALWSMIAAGPSLHPEAFLWVMGATLLFYVDFGIFREQFCVIMCPYGRLQSVMTDRDSVIVGYDVKRGEPRGKLKVLNRGNCIDCGRCVVVCPTGIDIRKGLQLDCIGCTACIDACDEVMVKVGQPKGLIRYDSEVALEGGKTRLIRPRTIVYAALGLLGATVFSIALYTRTSFEAGITRLVGAPFILESGNIRNQLRVHVLNKQSTPAEFDVEATPVEGVEFLIPQPHLSIGPTSSTELPLFVTIKQDLYREKYTLKGFDIVIRVKRTGVDASDVREVKARFVGP